MTSSLDSRAWKHCDRKAFSFAVVIYKSTFEAGLMPKSLTALLPLLYSLRGQMLTLLAYAVL